MRLFEWLAVTPVVEFLSGHVYVWLLLGCLLGGCVSGLLWRLVGYVPKRLQTGWREAAQQELGLVVDQPSARWALWQASASVRAPDRLARWVLGLLAGGLLGVVAWVFGVGMVAVWGWLLTLLLLVMAFIDARTLLLPDVLTLSCLWLGLLFHLCLDDGPTLHHY